MTVISYIVSGIFHLALIIVFNKIGLGHLAGFKSCYKAFNSCIFNGVTDLGFIGVMKHGALRVNYVYICGF